MTRKNVVIGLAIITFIGSVVIGGQKNAKDRPWTMAFNAAPGDLTTTGRNTYFILEPGYELVLADGDKQLVVTVLDETKRIGDFDTRVVEERESRNGNLIEVSRNFFAISKQSKDVYYFGEEVDIYKGGKIVRHEGAWLAGQNGARFGLMMPGMPTLNARYYQEIAPNVAMDRAEIVSLTDQRRTPAGNFTHVLKVAETNPLEPHALEYKYYAPDIGLLQDEQLKLVKYGRK
ncbi:MAG TPA: hypothetical protein VL866_14310 [Pyrinomonadaceae bacterium]|nr:hypothetical protein [Pyrinomonadaceae bacterium]